MINLNEIIYVIIRKLEIYLLVTMLLDMLGKNNSMPTFKT